MIVGLSNMELAYSIKVNFPISLFQDVELNRLVVLIWVYIQCTIYRHIFGTP